MEVGRGLEAPAARHVHQLHRPPVPFFGELGEQVTQRIRGKFAVEELFQLGQAKGLRRGEERSFEDSLDFSWTAHTLI